jgi:hypothetical protein
VSAAKENETGRLKSQFEVCLSFPLLWCMSLSIRKEGRKEAICFFLLNLFPFVWCRLQTEVFPLYQRACMRGVKQRKQWKTHMHHIHERRTSMNTSTVVTPACGLFMFLVTYETVLTPYFSICKTT